MLHSRDNPRVRRWSKLARDTRFRRREHRALIEGPHLVAAMLERRIRPLCLIASESGLERAEIAALIGKSALTPVVLSDALFRAMVDAETPPGIAAEIEIPGHENPIAGSQVFLQGIQDAGNVGAIVRSAAAFGIDAIVLDSACADAWSPKALRAGMGGHFGLQVRQVDDLAEALSGFKGRLICTVPKEGILLEKADLSGPLGWIFGSEGQGISTEARAAASVQVCVPTAAGTESLNVAATAAICLYEAFSKPDAGS